MSSVRLFNPFPGLRPFNTDEDYLFFGREQQTAELLTLLRRHRFLAVVGSSGSGKSSLVRAGLLPELQGGTLNEAGSSWEIALLRPGGNPIRNLARSLCAADLYDAEETDIEAHLIATLTHSGLGLVEAVRQSGIERGVNVLVVVDQFEEVFRFRQTSAANEDAAAAFVNLLLEASQQKDVPVYVILTMRSDYIGDCAEFRGLAEAVNEGEYLIPRLGRDQLRSAIEGPVRVGGGEIANRLVQELLNDVGNNQDQLPVLQHALMRTWDYWEADHPEGEPLDLRHYESAGGMQAALSRHADEIYDELTDDRHRLVAERIFKALTERGPDNRGIRRPTRLERLCAIVDATEQEATTVLDAFRQQGRTFLMPMQSVELTPPTVIDISHESLMRVWQRLSHWVEDESQSARVYRRLAETAALHAEGKAGVYHDPDLQIALTWRETAQPSQAWAERYHRGFVQAMEFLDASSAAKHAAEEAREAARQHELEQAKKLAETERLRAVEQQRAAGRLKKLMAGLAVVAAIAAVASVLAIVARRRAQENAARAQDYAIKAGNQATIATQAREETRRSLYFAQMNMAWQAAEDPLGAGRLNELLTAWRPKPGEKDLRGWEWYYLDSPRESSLLTFRGHTGFVTTVAWSPDGTQLASAGSDNDNTIKVWDARTGREPVTFPGHTAPIWCVAWSPDGRWLASGAGDNTVKVWDTQSKQELQTIRGHSGRVSSVAWSPDSARLASSSDDGTVRIWDPRTAQQLQRFDGHRGQVECVAWSPDGTLLASSGPDIRVWRADTAQEVLRPLRGHSGGVFWVAWSPDGKQLASAGEDTTVRIWNAENGQLQDTLEGHIQLVHHVCWSPDGTHVASASFDRTLRIWDTQTGKQTDMLRGHGHWVLSVAYSPDGTKLASASVDRTVKVWEANPGPATPTLTGHSGSVREVAWSPDGTKLASVAADRAVRIWDALAMRQLVQLEVEIPPSAVCFSPDGQRIATGDLAGNIIVWDARIDRAPGLPGLGSDDRRLLTWQAHDHGVQSVKWSPDGKYIASAGGDDHLVRVWDAQTKEEFPSLRGHTGNVFSVDWSPDGKRLASSGGVGAFGDPQTIVWDVQAAKQVAAFPRQNERVSAVAWSPDGKLLATGAGSQGFSFGGAQGTVRVWDVATGTELHTFTGHTAEVLAVCWSADGTRLASAGADTNIKIWDLTTEQEMLTLRGHTGPVRSLAWGRSGGPRIVSAGDDNTIKIWDATPGYKLERSPELLPIIDGRIAAGTARPEDLRLRGEINARLGHWDEAAADFRKAGELRSDDGDRPTWFLTPWWVVGPYPEDLAAAYPPETNTDPFEPVAGVKPDDAEPNEAAPELRWEPINTVFGEGLDFANRFNRAEHISAYAMMRIWSTRKQDVGILVGSDDTMRLWLNGQLEHEHSVSRAARPDDDGVPVTLQAGWNTVVVKVVNLTGEHGLYFRLSTDARQLAESYERAGFLDDAEKRWGEVIASSPNDPRAWIARADLNARRGRPEAIADYVKAIALRPADTSMINDSIAPSAEQSTFGLDALVTTSEDVPVDWRYSFNAPGDGWQNLEFDDSHWQTGPAPFGSYGNRNSVWSADKSDIWLRREFDCDKIAPGAPLVVRAFVDDVSEVYLNGVLACEARYDVQRRYQRLACDQPARAALRAGKNVLAVHCLNTGGPSRIDAGLYMQRRDVVIDILSGALDATSKHPSLLARRGQRYAQQGAWQEAASDYLHFAELDGGRIDNYDALTQTWEFGAAVLARNGDAEGYRTYCRKMLERFADPEFAYVAERTAKACLFFQPDDVNREAASKMAETAVKLQADAAPWLVPFIQFAQALAEYRNANYEGAIQACRASLADDQDVWFRAVQAHLVIAMAQHRLGNSDQAREALDRAIAIFRERSDEHETANGIICRTLQGEALMQFSASVEAGAQDTPARRLAARALVERAHDLAGEAQVQHAKDAYQKAAAVYGSVIADDPDNRDAQRGARDLAWLLVMLPDEQRPDPNAVLEFVKKAIPVDPQDADRTARWTVLHPTKMVSAGGATLTKLPDGSVLAGGVSPDSDTYTIVANTNLTGITAMALEALPHPSLPHNGPGRHGGGNFELHDMRVTAAPLAAAGDAVPVVLQNATHDYAQPRASAQNVIDDEPQSMWAVYPQVGQPHVAVFETAQDVGFAGGTQLTFTMKFDDPAWPKIPLGRFRLSVSTDPRPLSVDQFTLGDPVLDMTPQTVLAAAYYRAGDLDTAAKVVGQSIERTSGGTVYDWLLRSLIDHRLGRPDEAKPWFDKAVQWIKEVAPSDPLLQRLRDEAALLERRDVGTNQAPARAAGPPGRANQ